MGISQGELGNRQEIEDGAVRHWGQEIEDGAARHGARNRRWAVRHWGCEKNGALPPPK